MDTASAPSVETVLNRIRSGVRNEHPYLVGAPPQADVKLNQNESPYDLPAELKAELVDTLHDTAFNRYPAEQPAALAEALAKHNHVAPEQVLVGNGSNELTYLFGLAFIEPGTPVVLPAPMFSLYEKVARLYHADLTTIEPRADLHFDIDALVEAVTQHNAAMTVITTPNNPTGLAVPPADLERVLKATPGVVVIDEAYVEFNDYPPATELLDAYPNLIILRTLSKAFGLAGLRLGYLMAHEDMVTELMKARLPFMVDRFSEAVGRAVLNHPNLLTQRVEQMQESCASLTQALQERDDLTVVPSRANFVLFTPHTTSSDALQDALMEQGILIRNMGGYPSLQGYLRVCAGTPGENKAFLDALDAVL
ncbi:MAG: histidinol-phosphate transaminase [Longimonas sp.]|uniref:histidinol-phosphate transaminase n=1 Tax=Longimonas sp. TaxID=2039626 RepID=UPI00334CB555